MSLERLDRMDQNLIINGLVKPLCQRFPGSNPGYVKSIFMYNKIDRFMARYVGNLSVWPSWTVEGDYSVMVARFDDTTGGLDLQQRIESLLSVGVVGKKISCITDVLSESCNEVTLSLFYPGAEDDWSSETLIASKTFSIDLNTNITLKWENVDVGYEVRDGMQYRVSFTNPQITGSDTAHKIRKIKVSIGEKAQEWSPCGRDLLEDREKCLRYYEKSYLYEDRVGQVTEAGRLYNGRYAVFQNTTTSNLSGTMVQKRAIPIITAYSPISGVGGMVCLNNSSDKMVTSISAGEKSFMIVGQQMSANTDDILTCHWTADAEL